jgi:hypothetical protein
MFMNEIAEVHSNTLDFLGPFEIDGKGRMLFVHIRSTGIALDVAVMTRAAGDTWRRQYQNNAGVPLPPVQPIVSGFVAADADADRSVALPLGQYYVVIDNSPSSVRSPAAQPAPTRSRRAISYDGMPVVQTSGKSGHRRPGV